MTNPKILYSSDGSHLLQCKKCGHHPCRCPKAEDIDPKSHTLKVRLEKNNRGGKLVTVIFELPNNEKYFETMAKKLKAQCGTGGSFKDQKIEIQGDHRDKVKILLEKEGFKVKLAGG